MNPSREGPEFDFFRVLDDASVRVSPGLRDVHVLEGVDQDVKGAEAVEERQEGHAGRDLADHVPDLGLDLLLVLGGRLLKQNVGKTVDYVGQ